MNANESNEQRNLEALLADADPEERADLHELWALTGSVPEPGIVDRAAEDRVWQALDTLIETSPEVAGDRPRLRRVARHRGWMAVAASFLIGAIGLALWMQPVTHTAPLGERLTVSLPDGSTVELNSGATLRYARRFGEERSVHLEGEAFFDIIKASRPFRVETFNAQVEVLGTRFNVRAWPEGFTPLTTVTLEEGRVLLAALARPAQVAEMRPGETRSVGPAAGLSAPDTVSLGRVLAWRSGALIYHDELLGVVLEDLERRFGVTLVLQAPSLYRKRVSFSKHNPVDAESVIQDLCAGNGLKYRAITTGFELYDPGVE